MHGVDLLVTVGPLAAEMAAAFSGEAHRVPDAQAAGELLGGLLREGDTVLVKGSRGVGLEAWRSCCRPAAWRPSAATWARTRASRASERASRATLLGRREGAEWAAF